MVWKRMADCQKPAGSTLLFEVDQPKVAQKLYLAIRSKGAVAHDQHQAQRTRSFYEVTRSVYEVLIANSQYSVAC